MLWIQRAAFLLSDDKSSFPFYSAQRRPSCDCMFSVDLHVRSTVVDVVAVSTKHQFRLPSLVVHLQRDAQTDTGTPRPCHLPSEQKPPSSLSSARTRGARGRALEVRQRGGDARPPTSSARGLVRLHYPP